MTVAFPNLFSGSPVLHRMAKKAMKAAEEAPKKAMKAAMKK